MTPDAKMKASLREENGSRGIGTQEKEMGCKRENRRGLERAGS